MPYSSKTLLQDTSMPAAGEKKISICLGANGFSFAETDVDGRLLAFGQAEGSHAPDMTAAMSDLKAYLAEVGIRAIGYRQAELVVAADEHVWVPNELYASGNNRQYLHAVGGSEAGILAYESAPTGCTSIFATNDTLATAFKVALPGLVVKSQHAKVAESALRVASRQHPIVLVHLRGSHLDVEAFKGGKYLFGNALGFGAISEALFRVMEVVKLFGLQGSDTELLMCGEVDRERFGLFRPYFAKASLFGGLADAKAASFKGLRTYLHPFILL